jgi:hypothetical protein
LIKRDVVVLALAVAGGALIGYIDLGASEGFVPASMILASTFVLSLISPRRAWLWGIVVGLGVPVVHGITQISGRAQAFPFDWSGVALPVAFGLAGATAGWLVRRVLTEGSAPS